MALPFQDELGLDAKVKVVESMSLSIGASPVAAVARSPWRGRITKVGCVTGGAITTSNATITVSTAPAPGGTFTAITGATFNVNFSSSSIGQVFSVSNIGAPWGTNVSGTAFVNE